jgi:hypothetical protein
MNNEKKEIKMEEKNKDRFVGAIAGLLIMICIGYLFHVESCMDVRGQSKQEEYCAMLQDSIYKLNRHLHMNQWVVDEYWLIQQRIHEQRRAGYNPDTLLTASIIKAWRQYGKKDSVGMAWGKQESGMGAYQDNWLGEKGAFMIQEALLRDFLVNVFDVDTTGFNRNDYIDAQNQAKWAAFADAWIAKKLGMKNAPHWAFNSGAWMTQDALNKELDEFQKWKASKKLARK